ncbi:MAG: aminotransferase class V-fold PLP-dependent enzyme [Candidatus Aegiribacteria sp.]|nr:aminotransferase class V-fold PLP-dependent enzyme [Candidatus Aegiribacteria sp.]
MKLKEQRSEFASFWNFDPETVFLNHGSFGACPTEVNSYRAGLLDQLENQPVDFIQREYMPRIPGILEKLENFTGAAPGSIVLVTNVTTGINTVLSNLSINPGDELVTTGQEYFSSANILRTNAAKYDAKYVEVPIDSPVSGPDQVIDSIMSEITSRTVLVLIDHISSPTGMVFPVKELVLRLDQLGIDVLVDGAHGPGMVPLNLEELGAAYYTGNCHKWMCAPKTSALLYVRPDKQKNFRPAVMSHVASEFDIEMSDFQIEFFWNGTIDPTPRMSIPFTIDFMESLHPGGWTGIISENHEKAVRAERFICERLGIEPYCPKSMIGSMAAVSLPWKPPSERLPPDGIDLLQNWLLREKQIEIPVTYTSIPCGRFLRLSAQLYNSDAEFEYLCESLMEAPISLL